MEYLSSGKNVTVLKKFMIHVIPELASLVNTLILLLKCQIFHNTIQIGIACNISMSRKYTFIQNFAPGHIDISYCI